MSRDAEKDFLASPETEQLLSTDTCGDASETRVGLQRWSTDKSNVQGDVSSLKSTPQDKSVLNHNVQIGETSNNPVAVITLSSITVNDNGDNDNPPPYSAVALPNHAGWPYGLFSFGNTNGATCRMQIPLTPFQASLIPATNFNSQGINGLHALPMPITPQRFFKLDCHRNSFASTSYVDNEIAEKTDDKKLRRYGTILAAAAVIIFLMVLSLMVRFVMERSLWRR
ncbi:uncharacterized protein LOC115232750 isoform X1 [Formica exsecta]|uniref:uncharacterized protein LOC115232750 isoform X1 n=1 Tax=Formica exsecta TaxID=72781 RepID=UPI001142554F|nr:uncharacterized protein LOC115232750 isoform X1 [Formica exsecta]